MEALEFEPDAKLAYLTQTTLSLNDTREIIAALRRRFPSIEGPPSADICYATQNRQEAVRKMAGLSDLILVVGATNSSNSNRLVEEGLKHGCRSYLINDVDSIQPEWLDGVRVVGITSGASAPESLVEAVVDYFRAREATVEDLVTRNEWVEFALPPELRSAANR